MYDCVEQRARCFKIKFDISDLNPYLEDYDSEKKRVSKIKKLTIYHFIDPVLKKELTFTVEKNSLKDDGKYSLTLKIDHADEILIKLDLFYGDCEEDDGFCTSFKPKPFYKNTWISELELLDGDEYCLVMKFEMRLKSEIDNSKPKMDRFLNSEVFSDVKIISSDNKAFFGHRCILAVASQKFERKFAPSEDQSEKKELVLDDVDSKTLDTVLKFIYTGEFEATKVDEIKSLMEVANNYDICNLGERCVNYLDQNYSTHNVVDVLILADKFDQETLMQNCISFIKLHYDEDTIRDAINNTEIAGRIFLMMMDELMDNEKFPTYEFKLKS